MYFRRSAFGFLEFLIVITVLFLVLAIGYPSFRFFEKETTLQNTTEEIFGARNEVDSMILEPRLYHFDINGDAGRQREIRESLDHLRRRVHDVDQALVDAHLELLARVLVNERRAVHGPALDLGRQGHGAHDCGVEARRRVHDLLDREVEDLVLVRADADAELVLGGGLDRGLLRRALSGALRRCFLFRGLGHTGRLVE